MIPSLQKYPLQTHGNDDKLCLTVTLPLAERMIRKFIDDEKIEAEAEVQLYLMVLEKEVLFHHINFQHSSNSVNIDSKNIRRRLT